MSVLIVPAVRNALACLLLAASLAACNLGSYDDAVDQYNQNAAPPPPPPPPPPSSDPVKVASLAPAPGSTVNATPAQVVATFDRELDATSVNTNTFILENSSNATIAATSISVPGANPRSAVFDLTGITLADDTYEVRLLGSGASIIMDLDANALDGEFSGAFPSGNGTQGGDFQAQFTVAAPVVIGPTLDQIQAVIFTPTCATSTCHSAGNQAAGLDLSSADASHADLVDQFSSQQATILVMPGDPANSYLIHKLEGAATIDGDRMPPPGRAAVAQSDIDQIKQWITDGALR
ncbi:MAG: Ig-like domain-containing protein [Gammaproteobacteria bacterium]|nr:Ig-like domain-containing protein [Gammaproteobacteria bacterium]